MYYVNTTFNFPENSLLEKGKYLNTEFFFLIKIHPMQG